LGEFVLGILLAHAVKIGFIARIPTWTGFTLSGILLLAAGVNVAFGRHGISGQVFDHVTTPLVIAAFAFVIGSVASSDIRLKKSVLHARPLVVLGEWSFAFYLVHSTCIYFMRGVFGAQEAKWSNVLWYAGLLVISLAIAAALHLAVEKPVEKRLRTWWDARRAVEA
jgi:peptidoglycan/LPS O-acetylase OafA/YrhL